MKGMFIPEITVEMFRNACLESIEALMAEGEVYDIEYDPKSEGQDVPNISFGKWVSCSERLPEEHDSIFSKLYGTEKWRDAMFRKTSDTVICTVQYRDGTRQTAPCHTIDGEWNQSMKGMGNVLAWMPLPEPYKAESEEA